jgi:nucleoside-diphosphate-sugar epimerase
MAGCKEKALITGATTRMGASVADHLARNGYDLILVAQDDAQLALLADRIEQRTGRCVAALAADLADESDVSALEAGLRNTPGITMLIQIPSVDLRETMVDLATARRLTKAATTCFAGRGRETTITMRPGPGPTNPDDMVTALAGLGQDLGLRPEGRGDASSFAGVSAFDLFDAVA